MISVIVAVYNIREYISRCIESILAQSYKDLEILLIDDGSTDDSGKICDEYAGKDARIKVIHQKNQGLGAARNTGMSIAAGEFIAFVDGDDWIEPDMYAEMVKNAELHGADLVVCRNKRIYPDRVVDGSTDKVIVYREPLEMLIQCLKDEEEILIQQAAWNKLYAKELLKDESFPVGKWYEDVAFSARILSKTKVGVYVDKALYDYVCVREGSIMNQGITMRTFTDWIPAYMEKEAYLETLPDKRPLNVHRYHFCKRLLELYREVCDSPDKEVRKQKKTIVNILKTQRTNFKETYSVDIARKTERVKMRMFSVSPMLYRWFMNFNDRFILPYRLRRLEKK